MMSSNFIKGHFQSCRFAHVIAALILVGDSVFAASAQLPAKAQDTAVVSGVLAPIAPTVPSPAQLMQPEMNAPVLQQNMVEAVKPAAPPEVKPTPSVNLPTNALAPGLMPAPSVSTVPVKVIYVSENQPVQIVDSQGRLLQVIYLKKAVH